MTPWNKYKINYIFKNNDSQWSGTRIICILLNLLDCLHGLITEYTFFDSLLLAHVKRKKRNMKMQLGVCFFGKWNHFSNSSGSSFLFPFASYLWRWLSSIWCLCQVCSGSAFWFAVTTHWLWPPIRLRKTPSSFYVQCNMN